MAAAGVGAVVWLVLEAGGERVAAVLSSVLPWFPLLICLEGFRIAAEALTTHTLFAAARERSRERGWLLPPPAAQLRTHIIGYSVCIAAPAGRVASEAVKSALFAPWTGGGRAAAVSAQNQSLAVLSNAVFASAGAIAAWQRAGWTALSATLTAVAAGLLIFALAIPLLARSRRLEGALSRVLRRRPRWQAVAQRFHGSAREHDVVPLAPALLAVGARGLQALQYGILFGAVGAGFSLSSTLLGEGMQLLGSTFGDLVPAQLGATDGVFTFAAETIGVAPAVALAIAVSIHVVQLFWVAVGAFVPLLWRPPRPSPEGSALIREESPC